MKFISSSPENFLPTMQLIKTITRPHNDVKNTQVLNIPPPLFYYSFSSSYAFFFSYYIPSHAFYLLFYYLIQKIVLIIKKESILAHCHIKTVTFGVSFCQQVYFKDRKCGQWGHFFAFSKSNLSYSSRT